jgi:hypothetical protein
MARPERTHRSGTVIACDRWTRRVISVRPLRGMAPPVAWVRGILCLRGVGHSISSRASVARDGCILPYRLVHPLHRMSAPFLIVSCTRCTGWVHPSLSTRAPVAQDECILPYRLVHPLHRMGAPFLIDSCTRCTGWVHPSLSSRAPVAQDECTLPYRLVHPLHRMGPSFLIDSWVRTTGLVHRRSVLGHPSTMTDRSIRIEGCTHPYRPIHPTISARVPLRHNSSTRATRSWTDAVRPTTDRAP